jgi:hypothetical protein
MFYLPHNDKEKSEQMRRSNLNLIGWDLQNDVIVLSLVGFFSVMLWQSVLLVKETGVPWENHKLAASSRWSTLSQNVVSSTPHHEQGSNTRL